MKVQLNGSRRLGLLLLLLILFLNGCSQVTGQSECPIVQASDLGDTSAPSSMPGIIADSASGGDASSRPDVQLFAYQTVCLAVGVERDRYRFASVLAEYSCHGAVSVLSKIACDEVGTTNYTAQFDVECDDGAWELATSTIVSSGTNVFQPPDATFDTALRQDCSFCVDPSRSADLGGRDIDTETHCAGTCVPLPHIFTIYCMTI